MRKEERGLPVLLSILLLLIWISACSEDENTASNPSGDTSSQPKESANAQPSAGQAQLSNINPTPAPVEVTGTLTTAPAPGEKSVSPEPPKDSSHGTPVLAVPVKKLNFGLQPKSKDIFRAFIIKNNGNAELKIESVVPSWGCTAVDFPKVLPPGKVGKIKVKVNTGDTPGEHTKQVTIHTNDPKHKDVVVDLVFNVRK